MKTLIFLLLVLLFSCEKDQSCWICEITGTKYVGDNPTPIDVFTSITEPCDIDNIFDYQSSHYRKETRNLEGWIITTITEYDCKKK